MNIIQTLLQAQVEALQQEAGAAELELQRIRDLTPQDMYRTDLDALLAALDLRDAEEAADDLKFLKQRMQAGKGKKSKAPKKVCGEKETALLDFQCVCLLRLSISQAAFHVIHSFLLHHWCKAERGD